MLASCLQVYLNPKVVFNLDGFGGPVLSIKPYLEVALSADLGSGCSSARRLALDAPPDLRRLSPEDVIIQGAVNWGITATITAHLELDVLGKTFFSKTFTPWSILNVKKPVVSGCFSLGTDSAAGAPELLGDAKALPGGTPLRAYAAMPLRLPAARQLGASSAVIPPMVGQVWAGYQHMFPNPPPRCGPSSHLFSTGLSFQLVSIDGNGQYTFFGSAYDVKTSNGSRCMIQSTFTVTTQGHSARFTPTRSASGTLDLFHSCSKPDQPIKEHSFPATFSDDWDEITSGCVRTPDTCDCIRLSRQLT